MGVKCTVSKQKFIQITLVSAAIILMLISIAGATPFAYITNSGSNNISVIDTATNTVTANISVGMYPYGVAVTPDGTKVYVTNIISNNISVIDTATNTVATSINASAGDAFFGVAVNSEGNKAYVTSGNKVDVIDTATNTIITNVTVWTGLSMPNPEGIVVNPNGTSVYLTDYYNYYVYVIDTNTNTVAATIPVGQTPDEVAVTPDGTQVYVANSMGISVINTTTNGVTNLSVYPSYGVAVTPDGKNVYATNEVSGLVSVINTTTNTVTAIVHVGLNTAPNGVAVTPDGTRVYVANNYGNNISVIDTASNAVIATVNVGLNPIAFGQFIGPSQISTTIILGLKPLEYQYTQATNPTGLSISPNVVIQNAPAGGTVGLVFDSFPGNTLTGTISGTPGYQTSVTLSAITLTGTPSPGSQYLGTLTVKNAANNVVASSRVRLIVYDP
jgi:YVTN family beta-propeller protein